MKPKISLIIAVYEHPDFLEKILISLINQSFTDFETIVADDGSGPSIKKVIAQYADLFVYPIKHVHHSDEGFRKTIIVNRAVLHSDAEYLVFIDGDCILHYRFLEYHYKRRAPLVVLTGRRVELSEDLTKKLTNEDIKLRRIEKYYFWLFQCGLSGIRQGTFLPGIFHIRNLPVYHTFSLLGSNFSVFKKDYLKINGYDERIIGRGLEDDNLHARFLLGDIKIKSVVHEAIQYHLYHTFDPVPHNQETINEFHHPHSLWTDFGILKKKKEA